MFSLVPSCYLFLPHRNGDTVFIAQCHCHNEMNITSIMGLHMCISYCQWWNEVKWLISQSQFGLVQWRSVAMSEPAHWLLYQTLSYPWHSTSPRHTPVVSIDSPDPPEQSPTTPNPSPDHSNLSLCIPEPSVASPSPSELSLISIRSNQPFPSLRTSGKPVWWFLVMLTLSDLIFCPIGPRPLPNASGSFPSCLGSHTCCIGPCQFI